MTIVRAANAPSHASLADLINPARPIEAADHAVLLVHGFTGAPYVWKSTVGAFADAGISTVAPSLPGHAAHPWALRGVRAADWVRCVRALYHELRGRHRRVSVVGLSLGAVLARRLLAEDPPPDRAVLMATPLRIEDRLGKVVLPLLRPTPFKRRLVWIKDGGPDISDPEERARPVSYAWTPLEALCELDALFRGQRRRDGPAPCPTLMLHGAHDHSTPLRNAVEVRDTLGERAKLAVLADSWHVIPRDVEAGAAARLAAEFVQDPARSPALPEGAWWHA